MQHDRNMDKINEEQALIRKLEREAKDFNKACCADCKVKLTFPTVHFMCGHTLCELCAEDRAANDDILVCNRCLNRKLYGCDVLGLNS